MWKRFLREIVPLHHQYAKNARHVEEVKPGDVVVLLSELDRDVAWPIAIVIEAHKSHNNIVRKATLSFKGKTFVRSQKQFTKLKFLNWR